MKTLQLIEKYKTLLEQDEDLGLADATDVTEQPEAPIPPTSEGERYLIGLVVKAFLRNVDEVDNKKRDIVIKSYEKMLAGEMNSNRLIADIENLLGISPVERARAGASPQTGKSGPPTPLSVEGKRYLIGLIVKALLHTADDSEAKIARELQATILQDNPKDVVETIENFLEISPIDTEQALDKITNIES